MDPDIQRIDLITTTQMRVSVIDSGRNPTEQIAEGDSCVHVLWQAQEKAAFIQVGGEVFAIAPGDSVSIPAGDSWQLSPGQLVICVAVRSSALAVPLPPTHGNNRFVGHNRETRIDALPGVSLHRWKLTEPLHLSAEERIIIGLYADLAIRFDGGITMLHQGETSVIRPETGRITLVPNGLSYILSLEEPSVPRDPQM